jgi:hypothetical protein
MGDGEDVSCDDLDEENESHKKIVISRLSVSEYYRRSRHKINKKESKFMENIFLVMTVRYGLSLRVVFKTLKTRGILVISCQGSI